MAGTRAWLPAGRYVDIFYPGLVYDGDRELKFHRVLSKFPVLAKEGTMLPLDGSSTLTNGTSNPAEMELLLVVGDDAKFELIEEDESASRVVRPDQDSFVRTPSPGSRAAESSPSAPRPRPRPRPATGP